MLRRGFKTWSENLAGQLRSDLGQAEIDPLDARALAEYMGVTLLVPHDIVGLSAEALRVLTEDQAEGWSAVTIPHGQGDAVIYNSSHSARRISSSIMHELAHILIGHQPGQVILSPDGELALRSFDRTQEEEASWLAGCLLLPRLALLHIERTGMPAKDACQHYKVSNDLLTYRRNVTGVAVQMRRRTRSRQR